MDHIAASMEMEMETDTAYVVPYRPNRPSPGDSVLLIGTASRSAIVFHPFVLASVALAAMRPIFVRHLPDQTFHYTSMMPAMVYGLNRH